MKQRVYIETTIVSHLTARPSKDVIMLAQQKLTREWWSEHRHLYELYTSQLVLDEAAKGDADSARKRLHALSGITVVGPVEPAITLAQNVLERGLLPARAATDALHLMTATVHRIEVLLTWNCRHLANPSLLVKVREFLRTNGYECPFVVTPHELPGDLGLLKD